MQELEKILEEIGELRGQAGSECTSEDHYIKKAWELCLDQVTEIIRKHMAGKDINVRTNESWMPVEEALPEYGKKVLAYGKSGEIDIASLYSRDKHMWLVGSMCSVTFDIIAWRTLPAPYRQERSDNHDGE